MKKFEIVVFSGGSKYVLQLPSETLNGAVVAVEQFFGVHTVVSVKQLDARE